MAEKYGNFDGSETGIEFVRSRPIRIGVRLGAQGPVPSGPRASYNSGASAPFPNVPIIPSSYRRRAMARAGRPR